MKDKKKKKKLDEESEEKDNRNPFEEENYEAGEYFVTEEGLEEDSEEWDDEF
jgi:hypothetical protein